MTLWSAYPEPVQTAETEIERDYELLSAKTQAVLARMSSSEDYSSMSGLLAIVILGLLILIFGLRLVLQSPYTSTQSPSITLEEFANAREALDAAFVEAAAIERIFSTEDMEFISHASSPKARRLFLEERKALAIRWLRKTQKQVGQLMKLHFRLAGHTHEPNPRFELKLAVKYLSFLLVSYLLLFLLWLRGPFKARRVVAYTSHVAGYFCTVFSLRLESVNAVRLGPDRSDSSI